MNKMRKSGFTLVELVAVMTVLFAVMGVSVVLLIQVFDFQRTNSQYSDEVRDLDRLAADFRSDVHAYGKPEIPADGNTLLRWNTESATLDYITATGAFPDQKTIVRTLQKGGEKFCETYRFHDRTAVWCTGGKDNDAGLIALSLWTVAPGTEMPLPDFLNPFDRSMSESKAEPKYAGNWRTIVARYAEGHVE
jgi:type II secretory pathway pseudopilin PulG